MPINCGINFTNGSATNFTTTLPGGGLSQGCSSISDLNGDLLFYSNGEKAWNFLNQEMIGGSNLLGSAEATQSSLIVPDPFNDTRYYLFTMDDNGVGDGLNYYMVDMSLNGGEGMVLSPTQLATNVTEKLCGTKHANDYDYWVLTHKWQSDTFLAFHIDSFGVDPVPVVSTVGQSHTGNTNTAMGQMKISPDGTKIAIASLAGGHIELLSFDNATGQVSKPLLIESFVSHFPFGVEFSPDSRKLYYTQRFSAIPEAILHQFDLDHIDTNCLLDSRFELAQINNLKAPSNLQLGLDGRIYMTVNYFPTYDTLAVINQPNLYGNDADFDEFGHQTNNVVWEGLPGFVSTFVSDGIHVQFGTTCDGMNTVMWPADSLSPDSVRWEFGDPSSGNNSSTQMQTSHQFSHPDTFQVTLFSFNGGNTDTFLRNVIIWDTISDILGNDTTICNGAGQINLDASWFNACHEWSTGSTASSISVNSGGTYWVDVFYQSCHFRDSITVEEVTGPPQFTLGPDTAVCGNFSFILDPDLANAFYTWNDGSHDTTFTVSSTGTYSLTATNACGDSSDEIEVTVNTFAQPVVNFPEDTAICEGSDLTYDLTFEDANYLWSDGITTPIRTINTTGEYWVQISNACDTVSDTLFVLVEKELKSALDSANLLCTEAELLTLLAVQDSSVVVWNNAIENPTLNVSEPGLYSFSAFNSCGVLTDSIEILRWDTNHRIYLGKDTLLCEPNTTLTLSDSGQNFLYTYSWSTNEQGPTAVVSNGVYSLTATNRCAHVSDTIVIDQATPIFIVNNADSILCEGETKRLSLSSIGVDMVEWSNGETTVDAVYNAPGLLWMTVTDTNQCIYSDTIKLIEDCPAIVLAPNVFTPQGDGINDSYCVQTQNVSTLDISIYNRWGNRVHSGNLDLNCWDGQVNSSPASSGVYFYIIEATSQAGEISTHRGSFTLFR
ncbi:MAG: hypothetical protein Salg2KO_09810 [Salibacteraceae bacterium]